MRKWEFTVVMDRDITASEEHTLNYWPSDDVMFVDGRMSLVHGPDDLRSLELWCNVEAPTLLDAVCQAVAEIRKAADLHPVRVKVDEEHRADVEGIVRVE
ncbi:hypothetical protein [Streptomyces sp. NPDC058045]|uniref:hypothetical protein n=1 Tax=Streptomyces sp. NPDC058045 TaxID=3346311 RepID=UPI0036ED7D10